MSKVIKVTSNREEINAWPSCLFVILCFSIAAASSSIKKKIQQHWESLPYIGTCQCYNFLMKKKTGPQAHWNSILTQLLFSLNIRKVCILIFYFELTDDLFCSKYFFGVEHVVPNVQPALPSIKPLIKRFCFLLHSSRLAS